MSNRSSCLIIAGEKSGEDIALSFMQELQLAKPEYKFFGVGGDSLQNLGVDILYHWRDFSSMGFSEVIKKLPFYYQARKNILNEVKKRNTKKAILIDFQDFNLRLSVKLKKMGVDVYYVVAPQAWAWRENRAQTLSQNIKTLFSILPFEKAWFGARGVKNIISLPHPLRFELEPYKDKILNRSVEAWNLNRICLLPGSRRAEIEIQLPVFVESIIKLKKIKPNIFVTLVKAKEVNSPYFEIYKDHFDEIVETDSLVKTLLHSDLALATSGTVTLSCGITATPTIVCYKTNLINEFVFNQFIKYKGHISLTNLIMKELIFPELKQDNVNSTNIVEIVNHWSKNPNIVKLKMNRLKTLLVLLEGDMKTPLEHLKSEF